MAHPLRLPAALAALAVLALPARATPTQTRFGAYADTAVFNCPWNAAHTACDWSQLNGYNGVRTVTATGASSVAQDARGTAAASGEIDRASYLPALHAYAGTDPAYDSGGTHGGSARADANIWAVQGYRYVGATPFLLTITATLDSTFSRPDSDAQGNHSAFYLSLFDTEGYRFGYNSELATSCPIIYIPGRRGCEGAPIVHAWANQELHDSGTIDATISYLLQPGKDFYVGAFLDASVCCGATVDSSHTLRLAFNDATLLVDRAVEGAIDVPEPGTAPLALLAGAVLLGVRRRRRS